MFDLVYIPFLLWPRVCNYEADAKVWFDIIVIALNTMAWWKDWLVMVRNLLYKAYHVWSLLITTVKLIDGANGVSFAKAKYCIQSSSMRLL